LDRGASRASVCRVRFERVLELIALAMDATVEHPESALSAREK